MSATKAQIGAIHALKSRIGLDDETYRLALKGLGVGSSKELSSAAAGRFIERLKGQAGNRGVPFPNPSPQGGGATRANGALRLDGSYAGVCRALWLSAWNLGLVADRRDTAMTAFVKRQTGIDSLTWVRDPADGAKAIEGLKAWIAREAGVSWPNASQAKKAGLPLSRARKLAVIAAQKRLLGCDWAEPAGLTDADLDEAMSAFGRAVRAAQAKPEEG